MTEVTKTIPSYNPADVNTLSGLNNVLQDKLLMQIECSIPAIVLSYDRNINRATVKPAITGVASQGQKVSKEPLINIPVFCMAGGGIVMSFPVKAGDTGWILANDRNISIFKQSLAESAPNDYRKHSFIDGYFLPDKINDISISDNDKDAFVLQTLSGTSKLTLEEDKITANTDSGNTNIILEGNKISVNSQTKEETLTDKTITATTLNVTATTNITGTTTITGVTTSDGLIDTTAATGQFTSADGKIITVTNGIIKTITGGL